MSRARTIVLRMAALLAAALLAGALAGGAAAQWPTWLNKKSKPPVYPPLLVDAAWVQSHLADPAVAVADARGARAYSGGHIERALSVEADRVPVDPGAMAAHFAALGLSDADTVVCYSDRSDPVAAGTLLWLLELAGNRHVRVLNGGLEAWRAARGPVVTGHVPPRAARFAALPDTSRIADHEYVRAVFGRPGHTLIDWRPEAAWERGHVPHSLPFPLGELLNSDGTVMDGPAMRPFFQTFGPRERDFVDLDDEFVIMGDLRGADAPLHPYLAARLAGIDRVRVYPEGFAGWQRHSDAPVVRIVSTAELRRELHALRGRDLPDRPGPGLVLFDLRTEGDYARGHLPGAVLLGPDHFAARVDSVIAAGWPGADRATLPLVFYCYGPGCVRSRNCSTIAARKGYTNLQWYREGTVPWKLSGEPLPESPPSSSGKK